MSSLNMIKGVRQKLGASAINYDNGGFSSFVPFGTDGIYVDMGSKLNLEQQLLIGGNSQISIIENEQNNSLIIIEKYKHREKNGTEIQFVYDYSTVTKINNKVDELLLIDDSSRNLLKIESIDDSPVLVANYDEEGDNAQILINLYKGQYTGTSSDKLIHQKLITIELSGIHLDTAIDEEIAPWEIAAFSQENDTDTNNSTDNSSQNNETTPGEGEENNG